MKTKIEWYKEVLELEPHSKLFFPLARLYVAEKRYDEALETLSAGLRQHPEFFEARLLMLEVLNELGHAGDLSEQAQGLAETISGYLTFWQTWAHLLSVEQGGKDTALALNFLAARFKGNSFSWADVIERGIRSLIFEKSDTSENVASALSFQQAASASGAVVSAAEEEKPSTLQGSVGVDAGSEESASESDGLLDDLMEADIDELHAVSNQTDSTLDKSEDALQKHASDSMPSEGAIDVAAISSPESHANESEIDVDAEEDDEEDEPFSLRTRTMADLLAEQGDFEGALDIYRELQSVTPHGEGHDILDGLIKEMSVKIREKKGLQPASSGKRKAAPKGGNSEAGGLSGKKKLIDTLELLAQRLEARGMS